MLNLPELECVPALPTSATASPCFSGFAITHVRQIYIHIHIYMYGGVSRKRASILGHPYRTDYASCWGPIMFRAPYLYFFQCTVEGVEIVRNPEL